MAEKDDNGTSKYRIEQLEKKIDKIMDNHIPHMNEEIKKIQLTLMRMKTESRLIWGAVVASGIIYTVVQRLAP